MSSHNNTQKLTTQVTLVAPIYPMNQPLAEPFQVKTRTPQMLKHTHKANRSPKGAHIVKLQSTNTKVTTQVCN